MKIETDKRFILWLKDGSAPPRREDGSIATSGAIGEIPLDGVYLKTYAIYPDATRPSDLEVGGRIQGIRFLSSSHNEYDIYRVR
jgi:hypothetical protein